MALQASGFTCWLDDLQLAPSRASNSVKAQIASGIDSCAAVVVFITANYIDLASGLAPLGDGDNVHYEFSYACRRKGVAKIIPVVMEAGCRDTAEWAGVVGGKLGGKLYVDLSGPEAWETGLPNLVRSIKAVVSGTPQSSRSHFPSSFSFLVSPSTTRGSLAVSASSSKSLLASGKAARNRGVVGASLSGKGGVQSRKARAIDHRPTWDVFLTHDWGAAPAYANHARVKRVCGALEASGYSCWLDEAQLRRGADIGNLESQMAAGIDSSAVVIVFITKNYIEKASGLAPSGGDDNCHYEFSYACRRKGEAMIIPVVLEVGCRDTATWSGLGKLHGNKFVDLSENAWDAGMPRLVRHIKAALAVAGGARRKRTVARVGWSLKRRSMRTPTQEPREKAPPRDHEAGHEVASPRVLNANSGFTNATLVGGTLV